MGRPTADDGRKVVDRLRHNSSPRLEYLRITRRELEALEALADADRRHRTDPT